MTDDSAWDGEICALIRSFYMATSMIMVLYMYLLGPHSFQTGYLIGSSQKLYEGSRIGR